MLFKVTVRDSCENSAPSGIILMAYSSVEIGAISQPPEAPRHQSNRRAIK